MTCVITGHTVVDAIRKIDLGGRDLTRYMARLCRARGYCFEGTGQLTFCKLDATDRNT